jgi:murein DD-endopeptidase MepM/ murein hydrolase activator NlpD
LNLKMRNLINLLIAACILFPWVSVQAQEEQPNGPVYIIEAGDSLWGIAQRFGISMDDLAEANGITDPGQISIGARLVIPGLQGVQGVLVTEEIPFGENLDSLSFRYQIERDMLIKLNHFTSPDEAYAGSQVIVPQREGEAPTRSVGRATVKVNQSLMELAISRGLSPWSLLSASQRSGGWDLLPGESIHLEGAAIHDETMGAFPEGVQQVSIASLPLIQGQTLSLRIAAPDGTSLTGFLNEQPLNFFPDDDGYVALQGVYALLEPGSYPLSIDGTLPDGTPLRFSQTIYVRDGDYPYDPPLAVDSVTTDIDNNENENALWAEVVASRTPEKYWAGMLQSPMPEYLSDCFPSWFGHRRSYNGSGYLFFHTGLDFCGQTGVDIYAPAPGRVVFVGELIVRGNATVIDHGWGVYTAYGHQSEIFVSAGDWVETGDLIGLVGETGRVTGPHLHFEVIVGGVQVDPLQWLGEEFP